MSITYKQPAPGQPEWVVLRVRLDGKTVGRIVSGQKGYHYKPDGAAPGESFPTVDQCKRSIEGDE